MPFPAGRELTLERIIDVPAHALFRCWTEPDLLKQWFCPRPWSVPAAKLDPRSGGNMHVSMQGPGGEGHIQQGLYLEVVPDRKIVFTDAFTTAWEPSEKPFFLCVIEFEPMGNQTRYKAVARHWTEADCEQHKAMGFHEGWGVATDQLTAIASTL